MALKAYENMAACVIEELKKRNMEGYYCEDRKAAADLVCSMVEKGAAVSWGGSETTRVCHFIQYIIIKFFFILQGFPCFFNTHMI